MKTPIFAPLRYGKNRAPFAPATAEGCKSGNAATLRALAHKRPLWLPKASVKGKRAACGEGIPCTLPRQREQRGLDLTRSGATVKWGFLKSPGDTPQL